MVKKYRKRPVQIEAIQWNGNNIKEIKKFVDEDILMVYGFKNDFGKKYLISIRTLEGNHKICLYDYIIKGVKGEFYPCKPDIFENTYEEI